MDHLESEAVPVQLPSERGRAKGGFFVFPVATIDEGLALLAGRAAGERASDGAYPPGTVNRLVEDGLRSFARIRQSFGQELPSSDESRT